MKHKLNNHYDNPRRHGTANNYTISRHNSRLAARATVFRQNGHVTGAGVRGSDMEMEMGALNNADR